MQSLINNSHMVKVYDAIIPYNFCGELIRVFEDSSEHHEYVNNDHKPCFTQLNVNQHYPQLVTVLVSYAKKAYTLYCDDIKNPYIPKFKHLEEFRIKRYLPNRKERFDEHVDVVDHASAIRGLAFLFYLNDNDGDTCFANPPLIIHPRDGRVLVFPPTWEYPHSGISPNNQTKYIMSTYVHYG